MKMTNESPTLNTKEKMDVDDPLNTGQRLDKVTALMDDFKIEADKVASKLEEEKIWRHRFVGIALILVAILLAVAVVIGIIVVGFAGRIDSQAQINQHHTDCSITFALGNDPVACRDVKIALAKEKIPFTFAVPTAEQQDPRQNPAVAVILCNQNLVAGVAPPQGVSC